MNYNVNSIGFNQWANNQIEAEEIANKFCNKQAEYARKGYPIRCDISYNGVVVKTISVDGLC